MAPTDGRVARPERQWGCRRGTPCIGSTLLQVIVDNRQTDSDYNTPFSCITMQRKNKCLNICQDAQYNLPL